MIVWHRHEKIKRNHLFELLRRGKRDFKFKEQDEVVQAIGELRKLGWLQTLDGIDLSDAQLYQTDLTAVHMRNASLARADFRRSKMRRVILSGADLSDSNLSLVDLRSSKLCRSVLENASLINSDLREADLRFAFLRNADLSGANLSEANLRYCDLRGAKLNRTVLSDCDLSRSSLVGTDLTGADLTNVRLFDSQFGGTHIADTDLTTARGLETVSHLSPSYIDYLTFYKTADLTDDVFFRGAGVPRRLLDALPDLIAKEGELYSTFISYSHKDQTVARMLHKALVKEGVRVWLDEKRMKIGQSIYGTVKHAIHGQDRVILICSENSLKSNWVDREVNIALERELELKKDDDQSYVIMPISIDNFVFSEECDFEWTPELKRRLIGDFQKWEDPAEFQESLDLLIRSLQLM